jgi:ATP-dependent Clp protease ATP-binding subunit ClpB
LNRLDEIVYFKPLTKKQIGKIVRLLSENLKKRLEEKQLHLRLTDEAVEYIIEQGYDPVYGARPLKRFIQHKLETMLAKYILSGQAALGDELIVALNENGLTIQKP